MIVTLLAPTLAIKANCSSGLKVTLCAPLSAGIVATSLSVVGSNTCTLADFMFVTHSSAAQTVPSGRAAIKNALRQKLIHAIPRRGIAVLLGHSSPNLIGRVTPVSIACLLCRQPSVYVRCHTMISPSPHLSHLLNGCRGDRGGFLIINGGGLG